MLSRTNASMSSACFLFIFFTVVIPLETDHIAGRVVGPLERSQVNDHLSAQQV